MVALTETRITRSKTATPYSTELAAAAHCYQIAGFREDRGSSGAWRGPCSPLPPMHQRWGRGVGALALIAGTQCSASGDEQREPLEVRVLAASTRIEVYTRKPGDCHAFGEFRGEVACESDSWRVAPLADCAASSCVREIRLEQNGEVLARSEPGRFAAFALDQAYGTDARLVISGCGEAIELDLPPPKDDVELSFAADAEQIEIDVDGPSAGTFAKASTYAFSEGHAVACQTDTATSRIPVSASYSFYQTAAFAFDEPVVMRNDQVHAAVFPSAYAISAVSTQVDLGPLWDAAVAVAEASSLYDTCHVACTATTAACGDASDDVTPCAVPCVAAGEAEPDCKAEYQARVECASAHASCESTATPNPACEQADADWSACAAP